MNKKKISVFTCSRSEYSLVENICHRILKEKNLKLEIFVTGTHLLRLFGNTYNEISTKLKKNLVFKPTIKLKNEKKINFFEYVCQIKKKYSYYLRKNKPDIVILLGDRFETLEAATLCYLDNIYTIHLHGGEKTSGSKDDCRRHAISKLSSFHFVSCKRYKKRLIQIGENKDNILVVGTFSSENIKKIKSSKKIVENILNQKLKKKNILISYHPEGNDIITVKENCQILMESLEKFNDCFLLFTAPGADFGSDIVIQKIKKFCKNNYNAKFFASLGSKNYLTVLKKFNLLVGNSSSGILEAPFLGTYSINLGDRQAGREAPNTVINVDNNKVKIISTIRKYMSKKFFLKKNPYFSDKIPSKEVVQLIKKIEIAQNKKIIKEFVDIRY